MAGRIAGGLRSRLLNAGAAYNLQQCRSVIVKPPPTERYEVLDPDEAQRLRNDLERRKEKIVERYNRSLEEDRPKQRSFRVRTDKYMRPFTLDVHMSKKYVHAAIMHRTQNRVVAAASTNSKDMRAMLPSRCDLTACRIVGETLADRAKEADCYAVIYLPRKLERLEGKLAAVVEAVANAGISIYHADKGILLARNSKSFAGCCKIIRSFRVENDDPAMMKTYKLLKRQNLVFPIPVRTSAVVSACRLAKFS